MSDNLIITEAVQRLADLEVVYARWCKLNCDWNVEPNGLVRMRLEREIAMALSEMMELHAHLKRLEAAAAASEAVPATPQ